MIKNEFVRAANDKFGVVELTSETGKVMKETIGDGLNIGMG